MGSDSNQDQAKVFVADDQSDKRLIITGHYNPKTDTITMTLSGELLRGLVGTAIVIDDVDAPALDQGWPDDGEEKTESEMGIVGRSMRLARLSGEGYVLAVPGPDQVGVDHSIVIVHRRLDAWPNPEAETESFERSAAVIEATVDIANEILERRKT